MSYLELIYQIIQGNTFGSYITINKYPSCERNGVDQGIHNVLVYTKQIQNLKIWEQFNSPVLNLQAKLATIDHYQVKNLKGAVVAVVHQYDRYPELQKQLFKEVKNNYNLSKDKYYSISFLMSFSVTYSICL